MDETAVYMEDARTQTVDIRGRKYVVIKTAGFASMRLAIVASVWSDGTKLASFIIHKGPSAGITRSHGVSSASQSRSWVDMQLLIKWIDHVFLPVDISPGEALV